MNKYEKNSKELIQIMKTLYEKNKITKDEYNETLRIISGASA